MKRKAPVDRGNSQVLPRGDYTETLDAILKAGFCPFCEEHLMKHHRKPVLFRTKHWIATENAWPYDGAKKHFLLIARAHIESTEELPPKAWSDLQSVYKKLAREYGIKGMTLVLRSGDTKYTGASVAHLHGHLVTGGPRRKNSEPIKALIAFKK